MKFYKAKLGSSRRLNSAKEMKEAILKHGPLTSTILKDFVFSKSINGIYYSDRPSLEEIGDFNIEIVGWGEDNGIKYWICSCNEEKELCSDGYIRILMGLNIGFIEDSYYEAIPDI